MRISFRPHHFMCALAFQGKGYSDAFVSNFQKIMEILNAPQGHETKITVINSTDHICKPCPHRQNKLCDNQATVEKLDAAHAEVLKIQNGDSITWADAKSRIKQSMTVDRFKQVCKNCEWQHLGICEAALRNFLGN